MDFLDPGSSPDGMDFVHKNEIPDQTRDDRLRGWNPDNKHRLSTQPIDYRKKPLTLSSRV